MLFDHTFQICSLTFIMFSAEKKYSCIKLLMEGYSSNEVPRIFLRHFAPPAPNARTTLKWLKKLDETDSVNDKPCSGWPQVTEEVINRARRGYQENSNMSV